MRPYSIRRSKGGNTSILTLREPFLVMIEGADGWCIRLLISKLIKQLGELKGRITLDLDSESSIDEIIAKNGEHFFDDPIDYELSMFFINGLLSSRTARNEKELFSLICLFFDRQTQKK